MQKQCKRVESMEKIIYQRCLDRPRGETNAERKQWIELRHCRLALLAVCDRNINKIDSNSGQPEQYNRCLESASPHGEKQHSAV
jgi:hypothetical protein